MVRLSRSAPKRACKSTFTFGFGSSSDLLGTIPLSSWAIFATSAGVQFPKCQILSRHTFGTPSGSADWAINPQIPISCHPPPPHVCWNFCPNASNFRPPNKLLLTFVAISEINFLLLTPSLSLGIAKYQNINFHSGFFYKLEY